MSGGWHAASGWRVSPRVIVGPGDCVAVSGGPVWLLRDGSRVRMGERGRFAVVEVLVSPRGSAGILVCRPLSLSAAGGLVRVYVGRRAVSAVDGRLRLVGHRLRRLRGAAAGV